MILIPIRRSGVFDAAIRLSFSGHIRGVTVSEYLTIDTAKELHALLTRALAGNLGEGDPIKVVQSTTKGATQ